MYQDCKLTYCGTASQWSDFRQGTRGNIKLRWPSNLLWTDLSCFNETYQQLSCNQYCNKKIGPICREQIYKNILWPLSKENEYAKVKCDPKSGQSNFASRFCQHYEKNEYNSDFSYLQAIASWNEPSIENCIQENFFKLKEEVRNFYRRDNFDERKIFRYLEKLYQFFMENIKLDPSNNRSLFDISTVIDTIFYLIDAQSNLMKMLRAGNTFYSKKLFNIRNIPS
ncbi:adhesion G -coupled receptor L2-like [Brachionus plicatilis]|uniref:Adhesion G-coupled receptor L2-like n=1 Tax=Brachionus plicatilis TaxID=10195 RepID=A0A3M7S3Q3_BRAPC|nr:adhesion G -coupled receptor L2-like [Brachionus plicatilis]